VLLPAFVVIEKHHPAPMLDLGIFRSRLFSAAAAAAFLNGLARFALMFVFVFYFQGAQGDTPIVAGIKLAPLAIGMVVSSPLAGIWADRRGSSRGMAALGMLVTAAGLALMTTLQRGTGYLPVGLYLFVVGVGSGMFNSPNTAAMMGVVPPHRRGIAAGARVLVQNTGAVISIAFVLAIITSSVPKNVLFRVFSGLSRHLSNHQLAPFIGNMHIALWCLAAVSLLGAVVSAARPSHEEELDLGPAPAMEGASTPAVEAAVEVSASEAPVL
jgi:MFS family permease